MVRPQWGLSDPDSIDMAGYFPLAWGAPDPLRAFLRRVPGLGLHVPAERIPGWDMAATYRVQLRVMPATLLPPAGTVMRPCCWMQICVSLPKQ